MPTIELNKNIFEKILKRKITIEQLKDRISYLGTDLESISQNKIIVEVFPNRPDLLSEHGFCRAFSSFLGIRTGLKEYAVHHSNEKVIIDKSVSNIRPYTACAIVKELNFDDEKIREIINIQEKLHSSFGRNRKRCAIGIYPFEKIKTPIYYKALKPEEIAFRPLESNKVMGARQILSQHKAGKEYGYLLNGLERYPVFIDSNNNILSMPPVINSHTTGKVTEKTKEVFIECSGFDFRVLKQCLNILVTTLSDMGGRIYSMELEYGHKKEKTPDLKPLSMKLDIDYINKILGTNFKENEIKKYLERMGYGYNKKALIPAYRTDVLHQIDLAEDIAIAYGYEKFKEDISEVATIAEEDEFERYNQKIAQVLIGLGLLELNTHNLSTKDIQSKSNCRAEIEIKNAKTEYNVLRNRFIPDIIHVLSENRHNEYPQNLFDIGTVFRKGNSETGIVENEMLAVCLCGEDANFTKIKQLTDYLFSMLALKYEINEAKHDCFIEGRTGRITFKGKNIAYIGEVHPQILKNYDLTMPVAALELNLTELFSLI